MKNWTGCRQDWRHSLTWKGVVKKMAIPDNETVKAGKGRKVKITCRSLDGSNKKKAATITIK